MQEMDKYTDDFVLYKNIIFINTFIYLLIELFYIV